jgi:hypothetical protein
MITIVANDNEFVTWYLTNNSSSKLCVQLYIKYDSEFSLLHKKRSSFGMNLLNTLFEIHLNITLIKWNRYVDITNHTIIFRVLVLTFNLHNGIR